MHFSISNTGLLALALAFQTANCAAIAIPVPEIEVAKLAGTTYTNAQGITYSYSKTFEESTLPNGAKVTKFIPEAPMSLNPTETVKRDLSKRGRGYDWCGGSTFNNKSSGGSPLTRDCWNIFHQAVNDYQVFSVISRHVWHTLYVSGTCQFAAYATNSPPYGVGVGNGDVADLVEISIGLYQWFDKIGAEGSMPCRDAGDNNRNIEWAIFGA